MLLLMLLCVCRTALSPHKHTALLVYCRERKLMASRPDWVVGKRRFFLQWEDRPDLDALDPRKIGPF